MGRPTDEKKDKTVKLRISAELYEKVQAKGENVSETIRGMIRDSIVPQKEPQKIPCAEDNVPQNKTTETFCIRSEVMHDIETMCSFSQVTVEDFMKELCEAMNDGSVVYEEGKFTCQSSEGINLNRFKEACDAKGIPYQKMVDRCTQMVWQS